MSALLAAAVPAVAQAETELSVGDRLKDRREVAAGTRAYSVGFQDGRFYANGWHITGEMGGIWAPPLKLADGVWFGVDDAWVGEATKFTSGRGYVRYDLPDASGLKLRRTDFSPDGKRAVLYGLELTNPGGAPKTVTVKVDAHSELMTAYPWGWTTPSAASNGADTGAVRDGALAFSDGAFTSFVASDRRADGAEVGAGHWGAQPGTDCDPADSASLPSACDDGPFGKGTGGQLRYKVTVRPGRSETVWIAVAATKQDLTGALRDPGRQLAEKAGDRARLGEYSKVDLPGDRQLQEAVDWGKQNLADLTQTATDLKLRFTDEGKAYPDPIATIPSVTFFGAGYPDYPWLFATDGEYTAFAAVALGQFETAKAHLIALRDISDKLNDRSGKVAHEIVTDGSVYYGANSSAGNTDETAKFPSTVALLWRWTGDDRFRDSLYDFSVRNLKYIVSTLDEDGDGWPEGLGNVERPGMGPEKLDNTVYFIRGLYDLADMAKAKRDRGTERWAGDLADKLRARFDPEWWDAGLDPVRGLAERDQRARPAEALDRRHPDGGRADRRRRDRAGPRARRPRRDRAGRARDAVLQRRAAVQPGPLPHGLRRWRQRARRARHLLARTPRSRPSARATTAARPSATRTPTRRRCSSPTNSRARCPRSCRHRTRARTSPAAGRAARWSCRPGATTASRGR